MLFSKFFLNKCKISLLFSKNTKNSVNILKAPSRHKKFFHQTTFELFTTKIIFNFYSFLKNKHLLNNIIKIIIFFNKINLCFFKIGSNILNRVKISVCFSITLCLYPRLLYNKNCVYKIL